MTVALLLALALAQGAAADAVEPAAVLPGPIPGRPPGSTGAGPELVAGPAPADHDGWRHSLATGVHSTTFRSKAGSQYTFHSASVGYLGSLWASGPFLQLFLLLPLQARQDGSAYGTANYYRTRSGGDLLLGWQWRGSIGSLEGEAGPGLHATLIYLPGKPGYRDFSALPLGLGVAGTLWWRTGVERFSRTVTVGTWGSVAVDLRDPLHANDLARGYTARAGVSVGLGARR